MASNLVCYTSSGCNRVPHCADWGRNGVICYGSCNGVVVDRPGVSNNIPTFSVAHTKDEKWCHTSATRTTQSQFSCNFLFFIFLSHSLFISVFASVVYAACIRESGKGWGA